MLGVIRHFYFRTDIQEPKTSIFAIYDGHVNNIEKDIKNIPYGGIIQQQLYGKLFSFFLILFRFKTKFEILFKFMSKVSRFQALNTIHPQTCVLMYPRTMI